MSSISFKPFVVQSQRRADGTYNVKIRLTFKRKSRWIATNITATDADLTRSKRLKNPYIIAQADALVKSLQGIAARLSPFDAEIMDVDGVLEFIRSENAGETFELDFIAFGREIATMQKPGTAKSTLTALNAFERFIGKPGIDINAITAAMVRDFTVFVDNEPKVTKRKPSTKTPPKAKRKGVMAYRYLTILRRLYKQAREQYNDEDTGRILIPRTPFERVHLKEAPHIGQRNLGPAIIQAMIDTDTVRPVERFALDVFLLSFCLMGVNLADLYDAAPPVDGVWTYERKKTSERRADRARMMVTVPEQTKALLLRLAERRGPLWLNLSRHGKDASAVGYKVNRGLKIWAEGHGVEPFTYYAARHSWATIARSAAVGIDKATVDDCLNHVTMAIADIYIEKDFHIFDEANARVLGIFDFAGMQ